MALITLPQRVIGAPSEDEEEIIFSISTKTCSGGSEGGRFDDKPSMGGSLNKECVRIVTIQLRSKLIAINFQDLRIRS